MNFLSHFYFERSNPDPNMVMGVVLPDLVKNAHKDWNLNPHKQGPLYGDRTIYKSLLKGWNKHVEVDRLFHSSTFFKEQTAILKALILPALTFGPVKPFFLAHIALELILDHLLITTGKVSVNAYYAQLSKSNGKELQEFLVLAGIPDFELFHKFLSQYISSKYLLSYQKTENITYALNRICMRLWPNPFTDHQLELLTRGIDAYIKNLDEDFLLIFNELEANASMKAF